MTDCMNLSTSDVISSVVVLRGALERVSAMYSVLPGTWLMEYWNLMSRKQKQRTLGESESNLLFPRSGTNGLWSVSRRIGLPST